MDDCFSCSEALINPVCPECIANMIANWLKREKPTAIPLLQSRLEAIPDVDEYMTSTSCIKCHQLMNMCPECVSQELREWLKEDHPELLQIIPARFT